MSEKQQPLHGRHKLFGILSPVSWLLFWWLAFQHLDAPSWVPVVVYTVLSFLSFFVVVMWFQAEKPRLLVFGKDGSVKWKFEEE